MSWIDVKERLPPNSSYVLIAKYDHRPKVKMYFKSIGYRLNQDWFYGDDESLIDGKHGHVTHWMPLPDDPII